jgi:O-antigen/teichoic acid export membrane protein
MSFVIKNEFIRNAATLVFGTLIAQGLPFLFYPILSRIYSPSQFGDLSIILSFVPFVAIFASGMYECAIPLINSKQDAANLVVYIFKRSLKICIIIFTFLIIFLIFKYYLSLNYQISELILIVPLAGFFTIIINIYNEWCVSFKYFKILSYNKIITTSLISIGKLFFGIFNFLKFGLILGDAIGKFLASIFAAERIYKIDKMYFEKINKFSYLRLQKRFEKMSFYLFLDQVLNNITGSIHIVLFALYFNKTEIGYVAMALTILTAPITVIAGSIKDVFRQKANYEYLQTGNCRNTYSKLFFPILFFGFIFFVLLYLFVPIIFNLFLGNKWVITGKYSQILMPMFFTNFVSMSLGGVLIIANKANVSMYWQIFNIILSLIGLLTGIYFLNTMEGTLFCFMIARSISYISYSIISFYFAKKK